VSELTAEAAHRISLLREHALAKEPPALRSQEGELLFLRGWLEGAACESHLQRRAFAKSFMLRGSTPVIDQGELIVGKPCYRELAPVEMGELDRYRELASPAMPRLEGQGSHMAIDYGKLLRLGIRGLEEEVRERRAGLSFQDAADLEREDFYQACFTALGGVAAYADRYAAHAARMAQRCGDARRRSELETIAGVCRRVPRGPAGSFQEALQAVHFVTFCLEGLYQLGRPDRYLIDYYQRDVARGVLTPHAAQELIDCLCMLYNEYVPRGLAVGFMVAGRDAAGREVDNELTRMFLAGIAHTRMAYPGVGLCCTEHTSEELLALGCRLLARGCTHPAFFNDAVITRGLRGYGLSAAEACRYVHSTCVEITPIGCSGVWVASPYINLVQILLDLLGVPRLDGRGAAAEPIGTAQIESFAALKRAYRRRLADVLKREVRRQNRLQMERYHLGGDPLVSCFVNDCLERGRDIDRGGARWNWIMPSFVGLANLADSLAALSRLVFEDKALSLEETAAALGRNFEGSEALRMRILNRLPKYGNDDDEVDGLVGEIASWITEETGSHTTYRGDRFVPSLFRWVMHVQLGRETAASPDGRPEGFPLGDGSGPVQGRERLGPTASLLSSTKWMHDPFIGGIAVNMKFARDVFEGGSGGDASVSAVGRMVELVRTFLGRGGFELQINVLNRAALREAQARPEEHRDLLVRIGGYSDYFVSLSAEMQEELIQRTEHADLV